MSYVPKLKPFLHQTSALSKARGKPGFGFLMEMGTGKTKTDIDETGELIEEKEVEQYLVLAPKGVYANWLVNELPTHLSDDLRERMYVAIWDGANTVTSREKLMKLFEPGRPSCLIMNLEALGSSDKAYDFAVAYCRNRKTKVTVDEASRIKSINAKVTMSVMRLRDIVPYRRILTGLPNPNGPLDLYSQFDFLKKEYLGANFFSFRYKYANTHKIVTGSYFDPKTKTMKDKTATVVTGYKNLLQLRDRIAPISFRVKKEDCLDLPPETFRVRHIELTDDQRRIYNELRTQATSEIENAEFVTATMVITRLLRLHQVVCGHVTDDNGNVHLIKNKRIDGLIEELEELGGRPAIIWCNYRPDLERVATELRRWTGNPSKVVEYHGGTDFQQGVDNLRAFQQDGTADYLVTNAQKGAYGNTLTRASTDFFYSNNHSLELRLQAEARTHRSGQKWPVTHVDLMALGTVDEKIVGALRKKIDLATVVLNDGPKTWLV